MGTLNLRRLRTALLAGLATLAMALGLAAAPAQAVNKTKYIALGDSYAAGQGAGPYLDACYRSENAYAELAAASRTIKLVTNAACSGKTTRDVMSTQLRQLNKSTELVTITAGGNNLGFGDIVTKCVTAMYDPTAAPGCYKASSDATAMIASGQLAGDVIAMIQSVQAAAPNAKVVVTGYPYLYDPVAPGRTDPTSLFIYHATDLADGLNGSIAAAAWKTKVDFVDVRGAFAGHGINSTSNDPWINFDLANPGSPDNFHPNAKGYAAYFETLSEVDAYSAP
jgi:lysophospholipase L1-like esterase